MTEHGAPTTSKHLIEDVVETVLDVAASTADTITVEDVRIGVFYTGVKLSTGHGGMAYTASEELPLDHNARHGYMRNAGRLRELPPTDLARLALGDNLLESAAGLAAVNALAELGYERGWPGCRDLPDGDSLDYLDVQPTDTVTMVGAFPFFIKQLSRKVAKLYVTERNMEAYTGYPLTPADQQEEALTTSDVVLVTAATLVNHTIDGILASCRRARAVAIVGPTTPLCPMPFFRRGVTLVGGTHVVDADMMLRIVGEGGVGGHLWAGGSTKVNLAQA